MKRVPPSIRMKEEVEALLQGRGADQELADGPMDGFVRGTARYLLQVATATNRKPCKRKRAC